MANHQVASAALKSLLGVKKVNFSKSPRKGELLHYALKVPNVDGASNKIQDAMFGREAIEESEGVEAVEAIEPNPAFAGWSLFMSKDGSTTGLFRIDY